MQQIAGMLTKQSTNWNW